MCGALLPTSNTVDVIDGVEATLIDNGMPCVVMRASDCGLTGAESREALEADGELKALIEGHPPEGRADDELWQCHNRVRAEDDARLRPG
jgi:2-methylaconitate cis-trans-isomerase PrpF